MRVLAACCLLVVTSAAFATPAQGPQPNDPTIAIGELLDAYAAGRFETVKRVVAGIPDLARFSVDLQREAIPWIAAGSQEGAPRRRLIAAAVALEAAGVHLKAWDSGRQLVDWGGALLRQGPPGDPERVWNLAAVGLVQRSYDQQSSVVVNAARRFPDEDRFHLAAAIARELVTWRVVPRPRDARNAGQASLRDLVRVFEPLLARSAIRAEVNLRLGQTYLRLRQPKVALEHLTRVEPLSKDPFLRYVSRYLSGRAREAMGDAAGAEAAHRGALEIVPGAQSASFALAALAFDRDARDEANAVIEAALSGPEPVEDPWRSYQAGDFRFWTGFVGLLRRELQ